MKVLLINPPLTAKEQARDFEAAVNVLPPLGIAYIAAVLAYVPDGMDEKELKQIIKRAHRRFYFRPTYVARQAMNIRSKEDVKRYWYAAKALFKLNYASG